MPCHHALAEALHAYIGAAGIRGPEGMAVPQRARRKADELSDRPMNQYAAWLMIRRRAATAGITAPIGNHTFRATGITAYLANGGALEHAQEMAAHESPRTTSFTTAPRSGSRRTMWRGSDFDRAIRRRHHRVRSPLLIGQQR